MPGAQLRKSEKKPMNVTHAGREQLMMQLEDYLRRKKAAPKANATGGAKNALKEEKHWDRTYKSMTGRLAEGDKGRTMAQDKPPQPHGDLQKAILQQVARKALSPADITLELSKKTSLGVSQKGVAMAIHDMHKKGLVEMVGPSKYKKVRF